MLQVGEKIARMKPNYPEPENPREYHTVTRGWIANEIFRRSNPAKLTLGEFLEREISSRLHGADVFIGCPRTNFYPGHYETDEGKLDKQTSSPRRLPSLIGVLDYMKDEIRRLEIPSANGNCSARGLAKIGALMANKGKLDGIELMRKPTQKF